MKLAFVCSGRPDNLKYLANNLKIVGEVLTEHGWKVINTSLESIANLNITLQKYSKNSIDEFIFFYTGHGSFSNLQEIFQLEVDNATIQIKDIQESIFSHINPKKQAIIVDACYSSASLEDLIPQKNTDFLFSSQAKEESYELEVLEASIFSYYFVEAIGQNKMSLGEIGKYIASKNSRQTPLCLGVDIMKLSDLNVTAKKIEHPFVTNLLEKIENERAMVLFSQEFTNIDNYYHEIKKNLEIKFDKNYYKISIPSYEDKGKYFASIAKSCGIEENTVKELQDWKDAMQEKLENSEDIMLFVTDLEEGKDEYNVALAITLRSLYFEYPNLFILFMGRKKLASLVLQNGKYSPLASLVHHRNRLFFPNEKIQMEEEDIVQEFEKLLFHKSYLCELLKKEQVKRFSAWSGDELINHLFWKNLLVRREKYLLWRSEEIIKIGREVLKCSK
jgi:hypothetical protein